MHRLRLISCPFINPAWFHMPEQVTVAFDTNVVKVYGETWVLSDSDEIALKPGETVYVWSERNFYMETDRERVARRQRQEEMRVATEREARDKANRERDEANVFNATLRVPVSWKAGMKDGLSGLSANSAGNGCNAATVFHIWLQEDLREGRFNRSSGDFLCTSTGGSNGKQWSGQTECTWTDGDRNPYTAKITCKACLKIAERWN